MMVGLVGLAANVLETTPTKLMHNLSLKGSI